MKMKFSSVQSINTVSLHSPIPPFDISHRRRILAAGEKINWIRIAELIDGRSNKACRKRWIHSLSHTLRKGARRSPLSSQSSIAIQGDSDHQKHYCGCNTGLSMCQSSPESVGKPDIHGAGLGSSQENHPPPVSIMPLDQTSGRCTSSHLLRLSLNPDHLLSHRTP